MILMSRLPDKPYAIYLYMINEGEHKNYNII